MPSSDSLTRATRGAELRRVVMVGDQLVTDIQGVSDFRMDSVLVGTGLTKLDEIGDSEIQSTFVMQDLELGS